MRHPALSVIVILGSIVATVGCRSPYHQDQLALMGAGTGALAGAAIGNATGSTAGGAIIGGLVGAAAGSAVGGHMDEVEARNQALFQQHLGRRLEGATTFDDVISMTRAGLSDQVIITHIRRHGVAQVPQAPDLIYLKNNGVQDSVINALQNPPVQMAVAPAPRPVIVEEYHYAPPYCGPDPFWHHHHYHRRHYHRHHPPGVHWGVTIRN